MARILTRCRGSLGPRTRDGEIFTSPFDLGDQAQGLAYVARLPLGDQSLFVIAGVHALGSVGAVDYLRHHAHELFGQVGEGHFSMIVKGMFDDQGNPTEAEALWGPQIH